MRRLLIVVVMLFAFYCYGQKPNAVKPKGDVDSMLLHLQERNNKAIGKSLPLFSAVYQNKNFTNKNLAGKIVFINFWFASCVPCMVEMDALNELYDSLKHHTNFEFISFTYENQAKINEVIKKYHIQYKVVSIKQEECYKLNQYNAFPTSMIIDAKGIIKFISTPGFEIKSSIREMVFTEYYPKIVKEL